MPTMTSVAAAVLAVAVGLNGGANTPYQFRKSQFAARMWGIQGGAAAANSNSFCNGQTNTSGYITSHMCCDAEAPFTQVALIYANTSGTAFPIAGASVAAGATLNDPQNSTDAGRTNFVQILFGGLATGTVPAQVGNTPGILVSDFANLNSMVRQAGDATTWSIAGGKLADSYTRPLLHIRSAQQITAVNTPLLGYGWNPSGTDAPFNPRQPTKTGRYISVQHASDATVQTSVGAANALTGTTYGPFSGIVYMPVVGIIFKYASNAMSIAFLGDSITFGASVGVMGSGDSLSPSPTGRSWSVVGTELTSTMANPIEHVSLGISGSTTTQFVARMQAVIAAGIIPSHLVYASFSPNDGTAGPGATQLANLTSITTLCSTSNINLILWTGLPVGTQAAQALTASGELARIAWNNSIRAKNLGTAVGADYIEFDQGGDGSGQIMSDNITPNATITNTPVQWRQQAAANSLHPNYNGDLTMRSVLAIKQTALAAAYYGP